MLIKPILPGAIHGDHAGELLQIASLARRSNSLNRFGATQELILLFNDIPTPWIEARQLTNLRMRTFIATPSARNVNSTEDPP